MVHGTRREHERWIGARLNSFFLMATVFAFMVRLGGMRSRVGLLRDDEYLNGDSELEGWISDRAFQYARSLHAEFNEIMNSLI